MFITRRQLMWVALAALPVASFVGCSTTRTASLGAVSGCCCCDDPTCKPGCCPQCPPDCCEEGAGASTVALGATSGNASEGGYVCPMTGATLPCPKCCPLNKSE